MSETTATCPYCKSSLETFPVHKKKCQQCKQYIYVRISPSTREKILIRQDEIDEIEKQWEAHFDEHAKQHEAWYLEHKSEILAKQLEREKELVEQANFYTQQNLETALQLQTAGIEIEKYWSGVGDDDCEICKRNEAAGWIPLKQPFPSGHQRPLAHDGCRCDLMTRVKM